MELAVRTCGRDQDPTYVELHHSKTLAATMTFAHTESTGEAKSDTDLPSLYDPRYEAELLRE